ncbi:MAG: ATP-dependent DNA helicase RecG [Pirellulales bacterium]|nr:ATP-dependent DNA helicase RecG [Pirellulales bacterium]
MPTLRLNTPVQYVPGVGPQRAELFTRLGLRTAADLLFNFPRDYQDFTEVRGIGQLEDDLSLSVRGKVEELDQRVSTAGRTITGLLIRDAAGDHLRAVWFNMAFMRDKFHIGQEVLLSGKVKQKGLVWEMSHPRVQYVDEAADADAPLLPVYRLTEGLKQLDIRAAARAALEGCTGQIEEALPEEFLAEHDLWPIEKALPQIHFPADGDNLKRAQRRFIFQELLILQLALGIRRVQIRADVAPKIDVSALVDARIRRLIPFKLTWGQEQAIAEISRDLQGEQPMNRLLQGDVGSGKTIVAVYALLAAVAAGYQGTLMAPTEILARQHAQTLSGMLAQAKAKVIELHGGISASARTEALRQIAAGEVDLVIGTQALLQADVKFARLGLVVIDEQHKFGVRQRAGLQAAGFQPHTLVMSATPIPRTVTMTLYGDLDISSLRDPVPGRQPVHTYIVEEAKRQGWWDFVREKLRQGRQAYVVSPRVDAGEATSAEERYEALANGELEEFRLNVVHGRLSSEDKELRINAFRDGETQVLICTTAVEVGLDVPNATLMTIEDGERFGLAQLHQLRGRISRGTHLGFCSVFAEPKTKEAQERLVAFASTTDGFALAEKDFQLRGPGEIFGDRQHGLPPLRIADLMRDEAILEESRGAAEGILKDDPQLARTELARLRALVAQHYGQALQLGSVG